MPDTINMLRKNKEERIELQLNMRALISEQTSNLHSLLNEAQQFEPEQTLRAEYTKLMAQCEHVVKRLQTPESPETPEA